MKKVLIADDEQDLLMMIEARLQANGYAVVLTHDGEEALRKIREEKPPPDLIILDVMMPKIDGYKVCRLLKFDRRYKEIPVMILTARGQMEDKYLAEKCGADTYMTKPFDSPVFIKQVRKLLKEEEGSGELPG